MSKNHGLKLTHKKVGGSSNKSSKFQKKNVIFNQFKPKKSSLVSSNLIPTVDNDEYRLLLKIFIPNYVIKNNIVSDKLSMVQLIRYLPNLVPSESQSNASTDVNSNLNLQLHLFQATIVVKYINSWYLTKLNTDDFQFIVKIYHLLCQLTQDIVTRILTIKDYNSILSIIDTTSGVLNLHLSQLVKQNSHDTYDLRLLNDHSDKAQQLNSLHYNHLDAQEIINNYLAQNHVIFEAGQNQRLTYFRVLVCNILQLTFKDNSPMNSKIISSLIISLISDLVLDKVFLKIASPKFIFTLIDKVVTILNDRLDARMNAAKPTFIASTISVVNGIKTFIYWTWPSYKLETNILQNNTFSLINTVTNASSRIPYCYSILGIFSNLISNNRFLNSKINSMAGLFAQLLMKSPPFTSQSFCVMVSNLRKDLFYGKPNSEELEEEEPITIDQLVDDIYLLSKRLQEAFPIPEGFFRYKQESELDFKLSIRNTLIIFNYGDETQARESEIRESSELNQLLVIKLLDSLVHHLYPEL